MNLGWQYAPLLEGGQPVTGLSNVSCYVPEGYFTGVVGPTGAGKTTFTRALAGVIPHMLDGEMSGFVRIAGMNVKSTSVANISRKVAYVSQNPQWQLFASTVEEEIAFPLENRGMPLDEMKKHVDDVMDRLHIAGLRHRDPTTLSAGEAERVAIASALVAQPDVLVLDEATAALDADGKRDLFAAIADMRRTRKMAVMLVDQDTSGMARWADSIFLLVNGEIIRRTTPDIFVREQALLESVGVVTPQPDDQAPSWAVEKDRPADVAIDLSHVSVDYPDALPGQAPALNDVSLEIARGSFTAVTGGNASGKSTLVRLFNGLVRPSHGSVTVAGRKVRRKSVGQMARVVGYVSQNPDEQLFCKTVRDEIAFGPQKLHLKDDEVRRRVNEMLGLFDLYAIEDIAPSSLSYGERRAVALAATLAMHPDILVLDEPTAGLDRRLSGRLLNILARLNREGTTIVMVTNDRVAIGRHCSHVVRLDGGNLVESGRIVPVSATTRGKDGGRAA
nr:ABC transporter ATP-binding protein [Bifidobacterium choloepi]